jgi:thiol:disulfide interchange protein DsbC
MKSIKPGWRAATAGLAGAAALAAFVVHAQAPAPAAPLQSRPAMPSQSRPAATGTLPGEATLRRNLAERVPGMARIDEVIRSPIGGLYEIRIGSDIFYTDSEGNYLIEGAMVDTRTKRNLTEERQNKLLAVDFDSLPLKDAFKVVRGNGKRRVAMFEDPNCGFCKRMERDIQKVDNVTIYVFLYPILGPDSTVKSRQVWCAGDKGRAWVEWMAHDRALPASGGCDTSVLDRNVAFGHQYRIAGTPTLILADGRRVPGAVTAAQFEQMLAEAK